MEHVWAHVKRKSNEYPTPTKAMIQLWESEQSPFQAITFEQCQNFYHSMPKHIQVVLALKGVWKNY